jgi:hypothetical protein
MRGVWRRLSQAAAAATLAACSGGGGDDLPPPPPRPGCRSAVSSPQHLGRGDRLVDLTWTANRERGVNSPGGGYVVGIPGKGIIDVPYVSGDFAPTSLSTTFFAGSYAVTLCAYAALDPSGGTSTTYSAPSTFTVVVP